MALAWVTTALWASLIFQLSTETFGASFTAWLLDQALGILHLHLSPATFATLHLLVRKLAHLAEYAIFSLLLYHSFQLNPSPTWRTRTALWAILVAGLYSLTDEYHQFFEHGRTASLMDCGIDTTGAILAMLGTYAYERWFHAQSSSTAATSANAAEVKKGAAGE
jgi:VanZ family protein